MSKADLVYSEDFNAYQKDLEARLVAHIRTLHHLIAQRTGTLDGEADNLMCLNTQRALITELEIVIGLPLTYIRQEEPRKTMQAKQAGRFINFFRSVFGAEKEDQE